MDVDLPLDKLSFGFTHDKAASPSHLQTKDRVPVVLVSTGSFNPPTYMHLRLFELARDALNLEGFHVVGGYLSPVNDAYKKKGLLSAEHRIAMCQLACITSEFVMVDPWEIASAGKEELVEKAWLQSKFSGASHAKQGAYQRTLTVLSRIRSFLCDRGQVPDANLKVMLVCGSDLLESFGIPGAWIPEQVRIICRDYGVVCIRREGQDIDKIISRDGILTEYKDNIKIVDEVVPNRISSTLVRDCISKGLSVKYLTSDEVIDYIKRNQLYSAQGYK